MARSIGVLAAVVILSVTFRAPEGVKAAAGQKAPQGSPDTTPRSGGTERYIVRMAEFPVASYEGGARNMQRTRPPRGQKIDPDRAEVRAYAAYLDARHTEALARVGGGRKLYDYRYSFNGFTVELTPTQAERLRTVDGVLSVTKDELQHADTSSTPHFLSLDEPRVGLWDRAGGVNRAGEGIIIGIIDSGIWPESASFSDRPRRPSVSGNPNNQEGALSFDDEDGPTFRTQQWSGICESGEEFFPESCNQKLIGARRFNAAWGGDEGLKAQRPWEYASPRDYNGHGTHTASTAGGNHGVRATGPAQIFGRISGIAPRAQVAVYKALWSTVDGAQASGFTSDLVAAIDQAVADGVDVINYSITGTTTNFLDAAEVAFLFAADAGVFVSAAAGNNGPATATVNHPSPWITTVAAGTHDRRGVGSVAFGDGTVLEGASLATAVPSSPLIDSTAAGLPGANAVAVALCFSATSNNGTPALDPARVAGKVVVCDRGTNPLTDKSLAVKDAGGVGMILVNVTPNTLNSVLHLVPTVHLADTARAVVKAYAADPDATASIQRATLVFDLPAPLTAAFSSRGPLRAGNGDLLKPDVIAPGQDIIAAVAPPANDGLSFSVYSGTSMSAPHVAGLAALLKQLHHDWTPMMIKSALMTTATDVLDGGVPAPNDNPVLIFRQGAGHIAPNTAADPGLVYDSGINDWFAFLCGTTTGIGPAICSGLAGAGYSLDPSDLNVPSIAIGDLPGVQTVKRTVTNVGRRAATYTPTVTGLAGFSADVQPASLTIRPGGSASFTITIARTSAPPNAYTGGQLTWSDGRHEVRTPMVVLPVVLSAPTQVSSTGGPITYNVTFGYDGPFTATPRGLIPAATDNGTVDDDPNDSFNPAGPGVVSMPMEIAAGTTVARFSLFDTDVTPASDIDLYVYRGTTLVGTSGGATSNEEVSLLNPPAGSYTVYIHGFAVPGTASFTLFSWLLGTTDAGNMIVAAPATATIAGRGRIGLTFTGLTPGNRYLGSVAYEGVTGLPNPTIVRVDP
jgi:subtilisin family serine protease